MQCKRLSMVACCLAALFMPGIGLSSAQADNAAPQAIVFKEPVSGNALLTLNGPRDKLKLNLGQLEKLGTYQVVTSTFWPKDDGSYAGPLLIDVLRQAGLDKAEAIRVRARDGFSQVLPRQDWERWPIVLATRRDGKAMGVREKGPLRIIYPRNMSLELSDSVYRLRWVWLVDSIEAASAK